MVVGGGITPPPAPPQSGKIYNPMVVGGGITPPAPPQSGMVVGGGITLYTRGPYPKKEYLHGHSFFQPLTSLTSLTLDVSARLALF